MFWGITRFSLIPSSSVQIEPAERKSAPRVGMK
jgi:hypothetical protein